MRDRIYLLSLEDTAAEAVSLEILLPQMCGRLDKERRRKLERLSSQRKLQSAGAGLLLQLALQEAASDRGLSADGTEFLTIPRLLARVQEPLQLQYTYGAMGKPYLKNEPYFFSLSHSGGYVMCAVSDEEIGADIEQIRECDPEKTANRFFSEKERERIKSAADSGEKLALFYQLWCCKEAYGKLTGRGIGKALGADMSGCVAAEENCLLHLEGKRIQTRMIALQNDYRAVVCKYEKAVSLFKGV